MGVALERGDPADIRAGRSPARTDRLRGSIAMALAVLGLLGAGLALGMG